MTEQISLVGAHPFLRSLPDRYVARLAEVAGHALYRPLLQAGTRWVFASLQSQPLESHDLAPKGGQC